MSIVAGNVALAFFCPRLKETSDTQTPQTSGPPHGGADRPSVHSASG
jgi:hypothetical protein